MLLYLIRHGESSYNSEGRIQGQSDTPLSELGRRQGLAVAAAFGAQAATQRIGALFASPLSRALDTARPLADALDLPIQTDDRLKEIHAGVFQGLIWPEIHERYPEAGVAWQSQDPDVRIPGGESRRELMARGRAALEAVRETGVDRAVVVAHGGILSAALKSLLGIPAERNPFMLYNGSISLIEWRQQFKLVTLNQMDHLTAGGVDLRTRTGDL